MNTTKDYTSAILQIYLALPETPQRFSKLDYRLAQELYNEGVRQQDMEMAMLLATARRLARSSQAPPLAAIRSLHYFLPTLQEVTRNQMPEGYLEYLRMSLQSLLKKSVVGLWQSPQTE